MEIASIIGLACFIAACILAAFTGAMFRLGEWYEHWRSRLGGLRTGCLRGFGQSFIVK